MVSFISRVGVCVCLYEGGITFVADAVAGVIKSREWSGSCRITRLYIVEKWL